MYEAVRLLDAHEIDNVCGGRDEEDLHQQEIGGLMTPIGEHIEVSGTEHR